MKNIFCLFAGLALVLLSGCGEGLSEGQLGSRASNTSSPILQNANLESPFVDTASTNTSTFSIDVDTASYTIMRDAIKRGQLPSKSQVRLEEYINYFNYEYPVSSDQHPFSISTQLGNTPWNESHKLLKVALRAKDIDVENRGPSNLIFLIDTSGSMRAENKLPLLKSSMLLLIDQLTAEDFIGIVTYAGAASVALEPTSGDQKELIKQVINSLEAGGYTNGESGIVKAYNLASFNYNNAGINRVILATDGDFNVGQTSSRALVELIRSRAESEIFLTTLGFGMNYNDNLLESLADNGDGNYAYIDNFQEASKALVAEANGTLLTVAKDVKLQINFNSDLVSKFRLLGYNNRRLSSDDFIDDTKDAGDMGAGHSVTAFYELEFLKNEPDNSNALLANIDVRYKEPRTSESVLVMSSVNNMEVTDNDFFFAAAVAEYALLLSDSPFKGNASIDNIVTQAELNKGLDLYGYREEFVQLVKQAKSISPEL